LTLKKSTKSTPLTTNKKTAVYHGKAPLFYGKPTVIRKTRFFTAKNVKMEFQNGKFLKKLLRLCLPFLQV
jgi:hypothetical protein